MVLCMGLSRKEGNTGTSASTNSAVPPQVDNAMVLCMGISRKEGKKVSKATRSGLKKLSPSQVKRMQYLLTMESNCHGGVGNLLRKWDRTGSGTLSITEFTNLVRKGLEISPKQLSDHELNLFMIYIGLCDYDCSGLSAAKLQDFIHRGEDTFFNPGFSQML